MGNQPAISLLPKQYTNPPLKENTKVYPLKSACLIKADPIVNLNFSSYRHLGNTNLLPVKKIYSFTEKDILPQIQENDLFYLQNSKVLLNLLSSSSKLNPDFLHLNLCGSTKISSEIKLEKLDKNKKILLYIHIPFCNSLCYFCGCHASATNIYVFDWWSRIRRYMAKGIN
jgi:hypothetical protein